MRAYATHPNKWFSFFHDLVLVFFVDALKKMGYTHMAENLQGMLTAGSVTRVLKLHSEDTKTLE